MAAAKNADILVIEGITRKNIKFATWGGDTEEEKVKVIRAYHMFPERLKKVYAESKVKNIVMVHVQDYNTPDKFDRLGESPRGHTLLYPEERVPLKGLQVNSLIISNFIV